MINLPEAQIITSQLPALPDYAAALRVQWQASRHAENWNDFKEGVGESIQSDTVLGKTAELAPVVGVGGLLAYELSPGNENKIADIVISNFVNSGGTEILESAVRGGLFTGVLEITLVAGAVYSLHKFKSAVDVIRKRYFDKIAPAELVQPEATRKQRAANVVRGVGRTATNALKIWGLAFSTGAFTATAVEDASRKEGHSNKKNASFGIAVAGALAVNNTALAAGILYGRKTGTPYLADGCENLADAIRDPYIMSAVYGSVYTTKRLVERRKTAKRLAQRTPEEGTSLDTAAISDAAVADHRYIPVEMAVDKQAQR